MRIPPKNTLRPIHTARATLLALAFTTALHAPAHGQIIQRWLTQWGTSGEDKGRGVTVDGAGQTWVTGDTRGALGGTNVGLVDLFLTPLSAAGVRGTSVQRGGAGVDQGLAVAVVGGSTVFGVGVTLTSPAWDGAAVIGGTDALAVRYNTAGIWQNTTRFGSTGTDNAVGAAGNSTNLLVAGVSTGTMDGQVQIGNGDAFLSKRSSTGALVWTRFVGTVQSDYGQAAAFDIAGNAYLAGSTQGSLSGFTNAGNLGSGDLFLARYDASGTQTLLKQWGTSGLDVVYAMTVDGSGNLYLTGTTNGVLGGQASSGGTDAFLTKLDSSGNVLWTRLLGGIGEDYSNGLALDAAGNVWIGGYTTGTFGGRTSAGGIDAYVALYDITGNLLDTHFWGTSFDDLILGLAASPDGSVSLSGYTNGRLGAASAGDYDAWASSVIAVPEPTTAALLLGGTAFLALRRRR